MHEREQQLSALMDGELEAPAMEAALDELLADEGLRQTWGRYHLARDAMRDGLAAEEKGELSARIRQALEDAPTAPVTELHPKRNLARYTRPVVGFALAASVALFAVLGVLKLQDRGSAPELLAQNAVAPQATAIRWDVGRPAVEARLNSYLVHHSEYQSAPMNGMLPYVRVVGYNSSGH